MQIFAQTFILFTAIWIPVYARETDNRFCQSYCGNITIDYPFGMHHGCGHPGFNDLLFCIQDTLMLHIHSGSYRVLNIDYTYRLITVTEPNLSTCNSIIPGATGNGFVLEESRFQFLKPTNDNVFMLIGCNSNSPIFQGFPHKNLPCHNVSGMGCEEFYSCPAWASRASQVIGVDGMSKGNRPTDCCAMSFEAIRSINLTRLGCDAYSSAYALAPVRSGSPTEWLYGIHLSYYLPDGPAFCRACKATGGECGYDEGDNGELCMCGGWNSTTNCDSISAGGVSRRTEVKALMTMCTSVLLGVALLV